MERYGFFGWLGWGLATFGALAWGLKGVADFDFARAIAGGNRAVERACYVVVGLSGVFSLYRFVQHFSLPAVEREAMVREMNRVR